MLKVNIEEIAKKALEVLEKDYGRS